MRGPLAGETISVMGEQPTVWRYYGRFLARWAKDSTPWARDNILFAGGMVFLPVIAVWIHDRNHSIDWDIVKTTFWLYLGAFGLYAAWSLRNTVSFIPAPTTGLVKNYLGMPG